MGQKVEVSGTGYDLKGGKPLIGGTAYAIKKGRTLVGGTGYDISLLSGTPISDLPVGSVVKIAVNGALREFLIVNQGRPSSIYDTSCDGTWLLMKDIYENRQWNNADTNKIESSTIQDYLNSTFLSLLDSGVKNAIIQAKIPYRKNGGNGGSDQSGANGLICKVFLLSGYETGLTSATWFLPQDGAKLSYFEEGTGQSASRKRVAKLNGTNAAWFIRSPRTYDTFSVWVITTSGDPAGVAATASQGIRPAFILASTTLVSDDGIILG